METSKEMLRLCCGYGVLTGRNMREMKAEQSSNLAVKIHFASLNAPSKEGALTNLENSSC
jgi:hypothetical protein